MTFLIPTIEPLNGKFVDNRYYSLVDCEYRRDNKRKPILKFSIAVANTGRGPLHVILGEQQKDAKGRIVAPGVQRIFSDDGNYKEEDVGFFERHEHTVLGHTHVHWHYRDLASLDLLNNNEQVIGSSRKEGYCVVDSFKYRDLAGSPSRRVFFPRGCEQKTVIGISVGWADYYDFSADNEIEIENIPSGEYRLRFTINKTKMIYETTEPQIVEVKIDHENKKACAKRSDVWPC
jgi:hypothetical protein